ncbi:hypothetical protein RB595_003778 [Gaeumannomyces hyphopodioides]
MEDGSAKAAEGIELHALGSGVFETFKAIRGLGLAKPEGRRLAGEEQRFRLWAHSLGLHQKGHSSLDYRVRDAIVVRRSLADVLGDLKENLDSLYSILSGERSPAGGNDTVNTTRMENEEEDEEEEEEGLGREEEKEDEDSVAPSSESSFDEVDFRVQSVEELLDGLYSLATKIRNPKNRPQRGTADLYKHVPVQLRAQHIQEREAAETAIVAYVQRQQLLESLRSGVLPKREDTTLSVEETLDLYASPENWIIRRTGMANARRKQQFLYWKEHAERISRGPTEDAPPPLPAMESSMPQTQPPDGAAEAGAPGRMVDAVGGGVPQGSLATSATLLDGNAIKPHDLRSVISYHSRLSTVIDLTGQKLEWPPPPALDTPIEKFFTCAYCKILCPRTYLSEGLWRTHLTHDLQPYHCTYQDCPDPGRIYGTRQEWIDHESQHTRVWHCQLHAAEFETQPEYVTHLEQKHNGSTLAQEVAHSSELLATAVGPSLQPHRDCPFCPTGFGSVTEMQKHIMFHLERMALFALPIVDGSEGDHDSDGDGGDDADSRQGALRQGRRISVVRDFTEHEDSQFGAFKQESWTDSSATTPHSSTIQEIRTAIGTSRQDVDIYAWLRAAEGTAGRESRINDYRVGKDGENIGGGGSKAEVVAIHERTLSEEHPDRLASQYELARAYEADGQVAKAVGLLEHVVAVQGGTLSEEYPGRLASLYRDQGRWEEAEKLEVEVMETRKTKLGVDHPDTLTSMANLASTFWNQGRWEEAEKLFVEVMETHKTKLGVDHPDTLTSMANLASTYSNQGRWQEAEKIEVEVMETSKTKLGVDHPSTLTSMSNLAFTWKDQGRHAKALALIKDCAQARQRVLGPNHPDTLSSLSTVSNWSS